MILQALNEYYDRKAADPESDVAPFGFEYKELPFIIELDADGNIVQIEDTREGIGKKKVGRSFLVPKGVKRSVNVKANLLWGNTEYVLGLHDRKKRATAKKKGKQNGYHDRLKEVHVAFCAKLRNLPDEAASDPGVTAIIRFVERLDLHQLRRKLRYDLALRKEIRTTTPNIAFRLNGDQALICQRSAIQKTLADPQADTKETTGHCLIDGRESIIERLHPAIKGVWGAQSSGGNIVAFNLEAFTSYNKQQSYNAPVGKQAAFAYTTALNHLLRKGSPQRLQVADTSTVFWAERPSEFETGIVDIFGEPPKDDPDRNTRAVRSLFAAVHGGALSGDEGRTRFYVLGLAPNAARIAIRFWMVATVAGMGQRIVQHFADLAIVRSEKQPPYLPLFRLLVSTATQGKADNIPPNLGGETLRSILNGRPYPRTLLAAGVRRIRAEHDITYPRAALIKACLNRATRYQHPQQKEELKVSLDETNTNPGYRLGRLFAVLEKTQEEANPGLNATIRDRYYGAASSTPVSVFATLLKLKNHHLSKLDNKGRVVNLERLLGAIMDGIDDFPTVLSLEDQGRFAIGYYHQRQDFFNKRGPSDNTQKNTEEGEE